MFKNFKLPLLGIAFAMFVGVFVSCAPQPSDAASIYGTWKSNYGDGYTITETTITYDDGEPYTDEWGKGGIYGFTGEILDISIHQMVIFLFATQSLKKVLKKNIRENILQSTLKI